MSMARPEYEALVERAVQPYRACGRYAYHFARGKLRHDPLFRFLANELTPLRGARVLDVGCGQGLLFALLRAADAASNTGMHGVELSARRADIARKALQGRASIECADIRAARLPRASAIVIGDVLLYLAAAEQMPVLEKVVSALKPGGILFMREADAAGGARFLLTRGCEHLACALRGAPLTKLHYRRSDEWRRALEKLGLEVTQRPMSEGLPLANVLYVARKPP
jgi:2-polyprenyl-3-methyl-5-hydroxy-6-metoxy-1,4-benzoquinol methylase